ncbi:MAG: ATP-binding protein [Pseudomonadota bacterium]
MDRTVLIENPYRPGAGHKPPHFCGRSAEMDHFRRLMRQDFATENVLVTGLRGFGKTVLLQHLRGVGREAGWLWAGNDLSESASISEERLAIRILTDLATAIASQGPEEIGNPPDADGGVDGLAMQTFDALKQVYERTPGLASDRLKAAVLKATSLAHQFKMSGIILAYDEAQCLIDHADRDEYPMSLMVETVAMLQKQDSVVPIMLVLCGLPQVFEALTATRTYTERMFHVMRLERLSRDDTLSAIAYPLAALSPPLYPSKELVYKAAELAGGYPYLIQFFGKELVDQMLRQGGILEPDQFPAPDVMNRLDAGLFSARWNRTTDKQRELLVVAANREGDWAGDFSAQELSQQSNGAFTGPQVSQHLVALCEKGMLYRTRHGRYAFTVPMSEQMIINRITRSEAVDASWQSPLDQSGDIESEAANENLVEEAVVEPARRRSWFAF